MFLEKEDDFDGEDQFSSSHMDTMRSTNVIDRNEKTKSTALDAFVSKLSASRLGYFEDQYLPILHQYLRRDMRKQPIINRGYYTRVQCMRTVIDKFLEYNPNGCQILNIGAGFDTMPFHLAKRNNPNMHIFEIDFPDLLLKKASLIIKSKDLSEVLMGTSGIETLQSISTEYGYRLNQLHLVSCDLHQPATLVQSLLQAGFQSTIPTLIITECVLVYLNQDAVINLCSSLLNLFSSSSPPLSSSSLESSPSSPSQSPQTDEEKSMKENETTISGGVVWISYDMVHPHDTFGRMMRQNLEVAGGFKVPGFTQYPDLQSHSSRFLESGCDAARSWTMLSIYLKLIPMTEKTRINLIEMLDEVEEWEMLMSHYCVSIGIKGGNSIMRDALLEIIS